jgi:ADP-ribose pyrophosphatase
MIRPWKKVSSKPLADYRIFKLRSDVLVSPRTGAEHEFFVIDCVNWVNIIAVTTDRRLVMIEQYRHGSGTVELEIPGGMMEASDASPEVAGQRELREETGYVGENTRLIGKVFPNPAIMSNTCHTVMVENCECRHALQLDRGEDLETRLVPLADLPQLIASGAIHHSLVLVALYHYELLSR